MGAVPEAEVGWGRSALVVALWRIVERTLVTSSVQPSSAVRRAALRVFGAEIGPRVIVRPRVRVRFPWNLSVGANSWIGEGVWISNRERVTIGRDAVLSQETFVTTGSHAHRSDMRVVASPVTIDDGAWVTARCVVLGGSVVGRSALVTPMTVVQGRVPAGSMFGAPPPRILGDRFAAPGTPRGARARGQETRDHGTGSRPVAASPRGKQGDDGTS
nr:acetyltransferase [Cellulosimicrobium arenosum]